MKCSTCGHHLHTCPTCGHTEERVDQHREVPLGAAQAAVAAIPLLFVVALLPHGHRMPIYLILLALAALIPWDRRTPDAIRSAWRRVTGHRAPQDTL